MTERELEDLLWDYHFFMELLKQHKRQSSSSVSRADLVFVDSLGRLLGMEVKKERGFSARRSPPDSVLRIRCLAPHAVRDCQHN